MCGVWGSGEWACDVCCAVVWPPLHLLNVQKNHEKRKIKFSPPGINFCALILSGQILMNILNIIVGGVNINLQKFTDRFKH